MPVQETKWQLPTPDGKTIYGVTSSAQKTDKVIVLVHGLGSSIHDYAYKRAADTFAKKGYDVVLFSLYDGEEGGRELEDCTLKVFAEDTRQVISHIAPSYKDVFAIGHSYGAPTLMLAQAPEVKVVCLWDPSFDLGVVQNKFMNHYKRLPGMYAISWGTSLLINEEMFNEASEYDAEKCLELSKQYNKPIKVILAGKAFYVTQPQSYHSAGHPKNCKDVVEEGDHLFAEGTSCEDLLEKTLNWFKEF
ncbi:MAG: hypothetical protein COY40_01050 [Alphaproteobacteria bacterium CG_4_10_14_0_8_um_filter_53_9]|nr:MAG: hypothetical protein COY40_01050 [Alphaproteobacteria bacterium CG_4_10_14_0_8_um_filter_53_9]